jgi:hypothetical protein
MAQTQRDLISNTTNAKKEKKKKLVNGSRGRAATKQVQGSEFNKNKSPLKSSLYS